MSRYQRPVSPTEWLYLAGQRTMPPFAIQLVVEGEGDLDPAALTRAVRVASAACPGARLARDGRTWVDTGEAPPVTAAGSVALWPALASSALERTCEVVVAEGAVMFRVSHAVMDGRGVLTWAADVFRALRGEPPLGAPAILTDFGLADRLGAPGRRPRMSAGWRSPLTAPPHAAGPATAGLGPAGQSSARQGWARRSVDGNHPGLVAKLATAVAGFTGAGRSRFLVPVDLRRHDPALRSTANLSLPVFLTAGPDETWQSLHKQILRALVERREVTGGAAERAAYRLPLGLLARSLRMAGDRHLCTAILSHLGRIDPAEFSADGFRASTVYSLPTHAPLAPLSIVATAPPGRTELTVAHHGTPERAEALLDAVEAALSPHRHWAGNDTRRAVPRATLTGLFARQVAAAPGAVALTGPFGEVSYAELDARADAVAHALRERDVGRGDVVGLLADRTVEAVAAILGVLKAGAAYLPLDPQHPDGRIGHVLRDAGAPLCLLGRRHAGRVGVEHLILEDLPTGGAPPADDAATPDDLAYVIYTSGSTGRPKGVQVEHRSLVNYVTWAREEYRVDTGTRFALFTSLAFDLTGTALLLPLLAGGSVALVPDEPTHVSLREMLERSGANALKLTPAHLDLIGRLGLTPAGFRVLVVGGEQLRPAVAAAALRAFGPHCRIVNEYGPTEATIGCVVHEFDPDRDTGAAVPIGRPVANTSVFLLNADGRFVAPGETGELHLAGEQLARGYRGRPDLDGERFVRLADGTRVYRTGDLARVVDGELEYLGRTDDQLKIRGYRIEPAEIAAALESYPGIARAVVTGRAARRGTDPVLCAYVVGAVASEQDVRDHLARCLPRYLVPAVIVTVDELPRTTNGKIDVGALPDPFAQRAVTPPSGGPAPGTVEERVSQIFARILRVDRTLIGPDTDFHALGGDSLSMIEMLAAVAAELPDPSTRDTLAGSVIRNPTPAAVTAVIRGGAPAPGGAR
ncbi:amino acid adenylation domain-containing protein [Krasilnikovia cinnamomea]|uniref:Amino acid adenylation domain-containing protein n=1 Tax=Krasilnikovia cinnamomea TaxID=349313 RepID=A0A4Q7ZUF4_9ACTN|nr:amino acid adenylation domain-containing protein [Krasilnikovia cinnamomea]RZU54215.1 amino acid adenylation domain-containing protein [Krasilnikovia cinnamomea]